ncbi:MAG: hypothetical protein ACXAEX_13520 [Promethearchaeota archaeon]|jgi:predicted nucleic acid-binding Zn finger protein
MSKDLLLKVFERAKQKQLLDEEFISYLDTVFPGKSPDVVEVMKRGVTKYICKPSNRIVWTAMGTNQEHLIYPRFFCSCQDFYKSVVIQSKRNFCKHILAQTLSEGFNNYKEKVLEDKKFKELVKDLKLQI